MDGESSGAERRTALYAVLGRTGRWHGSGNCMHTSRSNGLCIVSGSNDAVRARQWDSEEADRTVQSILGPLVAQTAPCHAGSARCRPDIAEKTR